MAATSATPAITPTEVQTSVIRWWPSASSAMLCSRLPVAISSRPQARLMPEASADSAMPRSGTAIGCGSAKRGAAAKTMLPAASTISAPSMPLAKYSALKRP
ncbi:hypothetical protein D3C83_62810 [compost metagenome]